MESRETSAPIEQRDNKLLMELTPDSGDINAAIRAGYLAGARLFIFREGEYKTTNDGFAFLYLHDYPQAITLASKPGEQVIFSGNESVLHVVAIGHNVGDVRFDGIEIANGSTYDNTVRAAALAAWPKGESASLYYFVDGAGLLDYGEGNVTIHNCTLDNNEAFVCGGNISVQKPPGASGIVRIQDSQISHGVAGHTGGGIDVLTPSTVVIENSTFFGNRSNHRWLTGGPHGGSVTVFPGAGVFIYDCQFTSDRSKPVAPQIDYRDPAAIVVQNSTFIIRGAPDKLEYGDDPEILYKRLIIDSGKNKSPLLTRLEFLPDLRQLLRVMKVARPGIPKANREDTWRINGQIEAEINRIQMQNGETKPVLHMPYFAGNTLRFQS